MVLDWVEGITAALRDFAGLKAHWAMWLNVTDQMRQQAPPPLPRPLAAETPASALTPAPGSSSTTPTATHG